MLEPCPREVVRVIPAPGEGPLVLSPVEGSSGEAHVRKPITFTVPSENPKCP